jgi:dihydropteroate synthase
MLTESQNTWTIRGEKALAFPPFLVAGIVNITPDSFSDGGLYLQSGAALAHGQNLFAEGASILELGGESTRPGAAPVSAKVETARVLPVLREFLNWRAAQRQGEEFPLFSVDTRRSGTAKDALEAGAEIINDISGGQFDQEMAEVLAHYRPGYILCHSQGSPETMQQAPRYADVLEEVYVFFASRLERLEKIGFPSGHIVVDPGIGFGKTLQHNLALLAGLDRLQDLGRPLCLGVSRKSLFKTLLGLEPNSDSDAATQVMIALTAARGAQIHRVHSVKGALDALKIVRAITEPLA